MTMPFENLGATHQRRLWIVFPTDCLQEGSTGVAEAGDRILAHVGVVDVEPLVQGPALVGSLFAIIQ
jgi:hypothetical protein